MADDEHLKGGLRKSAGARGHAKCTSPLRRGFEGGAWGKRFRLIMEE